MIYAIWSMELSQSSRSTPDPLSDILDVLGARISRRTRMEAAGQWALAFPALDRLKFVAMLRGSQWLLRPNHDPQLLSAGDVCLLGRTAYTVASDVALPAADGQAVYDAAGDDVAHLGGDDVIAIGGTVTFDAAEADFFLDMLPDALFLSGSAPASGTIATILQLIAKEIEEDLLGRAIVSARLADVLLVEAIRAYGRQAPMGWLGALSDPRLGRALRAIHADTTEPWTVERLAGVAGMSRAAFSAEFMRRVGQPPLSYLRMWRLMAARTALHRGGMTVAQAALAVGYTSQSAFSHAFRRAFGASPKAGRRF
ncbi:AraC-like DNA-binding protein [Sphingomonas zeicaulis]|uniref:AraC family transcriptional regulator n=1 Tax=Sphingomonas zeicaulis TaxID=1632740 RepID=UPI003D1EA350